MGRRKSKSRRRKRKNQQKMRMAVASTSAPPPPPPPPPPWIELPRDVTANILQRLGALEILGSAQKVCAIWWKVCQDPSMWRVIDMKNPGYMFDRIPYLCRLAVNRSQGQLVDLSIHHFGDIELLFYVVERSSHLRRLTLNSCHQISGEGLAEAVKRLPHLEELHLTITPLVLAAAVEAIGISCPMLKSFTFNRYMYNHRFSVFAEDDEQMATLSNAYALAIANSMPNLRHLVLVGDYINNEGLKAILDGCPHLTSLDLRQCFDLDLRGDLGKRCSKQIKNLRLPSDSTSDMEWHPCELSDHWFSDIYSFGSYDDYQYGYNEDFEFYDDYINPYSAEYSFDRRAMDLYSF